MSSLTRLGVLGLALLTMVGPHAAEGQRLRDICPLAARLSLDRHEGRCVGRRILPLPVTAVFEPDAVAEGLAPLAVTAGLSARTGYPVDRANGAAWAGRGASGWVSGGIRARWGPVRLALQPVIHGSENRAVLTPDTTVEGRASLGYPWAYGDLDWYLRPGDGPRWSVDPGDSYLELRSGYARLGVSTERLRWGPARRYPLLFSGTAGGFPHAYLGTGRDLVTYLGTFSGEILWGRLDESHWFDADPRNDLRLLSALQVRWLPEVVPGLELAYSVARHEPLPHGRLQKRQLLDVVTGDPDGEGVDRQGMPLGTFAFRLGVPDAGVEMYAEIGRGEGFLVPQPGVSDTRLSRIYLMGFTRSDTTTSGRTWRVSGEVITQALELPQPDGSTAGPPVDRAPNHGHTHAGQLLGAYIGPGSNAQYLSFDLLDEAWTAGFFLERIRRDDDTYFRSLARFYGFRGHDVEWTIGARGGGWLDISAIERLVGPLAGGIEVGLSRRKNRNFTGLLTGDWVFLREWNVWADVYLSWDPRLRP